jgi:hypothetical protein
MSGRRANLIGLQGLEPLFFGFLNVAAEAATHKDHLWSSFVAPGAGGSVRLRHCGSGLQP